MSDTDEIVSCDKLVAMARAAAESHRLDAELVCAIVEQESSWNPWAIQYEPAFFAKYVEPSVAKLHLSATEASARATSWGLMQVMGQVAREHGFRGEYLSELCDPGNGLDVGCRLFVAKLAAAKGDVETALRLWNGGGNANYADEVLARIRSLSA